MVSSLNGPDGAHKAGEGEKMEVNRDGKRRRENGGLGRAGREMRAILA